MKEEVMTQFSHVALNCADVDSSVGWYCQHFGFEVARRLPIGGGKEIVFLRSGQVRLELFPTDAPAASADKDGPATTGTLRHIAFQVDSVDAHIAAMGQEAVVTLGPLDFDAFIPGWRTAWLQDPSGHVVEITQGYTD